MSDSGGAGADRATRAADETGLVSDRATDGAQTDNGERAGESAAPSGERREVVPSSPEMDSLGAGRTRTGDPKGDPGGVSNAGEGASGSGGRKVGADSGPGETGAVSNAGEGVADSGSGVGAAGSRGGEDVAADSGPGQDAADSRSGAGDASTTGRSGVAAGDGGGDGTVDAGKAAEQRSAEGDEGAVNSVESSNGFEQFKDDLDAVERRIAGEIDPGVRAMVVAGAVFLLLFSLVLSHAGGARGFDVLLGTDAARAEHIGLPSRIFVWFAVLFGIGFSLLALMTRRWVLAWIAVAGSAIGSVFGVFSIWHRQTPGLGNYHGAGPGVGLILGTIAIIVLTFHWIRVVWSRTALQLAAEEQRRNAAAAAEERDRRRLTGDS